MSASGQDVAACAETTSRTIALVGDYSPDVVAHRAIPLALELAARDPSARRGRRRVTWSWIRTRDLRDAPRDLAIYSAIWLVPGSPYENTAGALAAIRFARETQRPFLGTCGGFQHALLEFARNVAGIPRAEHAEANAAAQALVVTPLSCSLIERAGEVRFAPGARLLSIYGRDSAVEGYHCNYGMNPRFRTVLERAGLRFTAFDSAGEIRAAELPESTHPFFIATLFQRERAALHSECPPLIRAFVTAAALVQT